MQSQSTEEINPEVTIQPSQKQVDFKTKLRFIDIQRKHETVISIQPPIITQAGTLQFLLADRLVNFPIHGVIFSWETEQLQAVEPPRIILGEK